MKKLLVGVTIMALAGLSVLAQGTVSFNNRISASLNSPVTIATGGLPTGSDYWAQLFAGPAGSAEGALTAVGTPALFRTGAAAGFWTAATLSIPGVGAGQTAVLQVRAWYSQNGTYATHAAALAAGRLAGTSALFNISLGGDPGGGGLPIVTPNILGNTDNGVGLPENFTGFALVPEPTTLALGLLGAAGLLFIRRRK